MVDPLSGAEPRGPGTRKSRLAQKNNLTPRYRVWNIVEIESLFVSYTPNSTTGRKLQITPVYYKKKKIYKQKSVKIEHESFTKYFKSEE